AVAVAAGSSPAVAAAARETAEELVDQVLEHDGGLGLQDLAAVLQVRAEPPRADADVLPAQQALGLDAGIAVLGDLLELRINAQVNFRPEALVVQVDLGHIADPHSRQPNGRADLEVPDVVEFRGHIVAGSLADAELEPAVGQLGGEEDQREQAQNHEEPGSDLERASSAHGSGDPIT